MCSNFGQISAVPVIVPSPLPRKIRRCFYTCYSDSQPVRNIDIVVFAGIHKRPEWLITVLIRLRRLSATTSNIWREGTNIGIPTVGWSVNSTFFSFIFYITLATPTSVSFDLMEPWLSKGFVSFNIVCLHIEINKKLVSPPTPMLQFERHACIVVPFTQPQYKFKMFDFPIRELLPWVKLNSL